MWHIGDEEHDRKDLMDGDFNRQDMEKAMKFLLDNQEFLEASQNALAQITKAKLDALVSAGFTRTEAMEIIKARGLSA